MRLALPILAVIASICGVLSTPAQAEERSLVARSGTPSTSGIWNGYYYYWVNNCGVAVPIPGSATYTYGYSSAQFSVNWSGESCYVIAGKGWNPGSSSRTIHYSGNYNPNSASSLSIYGWTRSPLIEYHIVDYYTVSDPSSAFGAQKKGAATCDGANFDILQTTRYNQSSIDGTQTFQQFWSVRNPPKTPGTGISGTVTTNCHFNAWRNLGMNLGSQHNFQVVAVEGHNGTGSATITVS